MEDHKGNIFGDIPESSAEVFEDLLKRGAVRIERIVSAGRSSDEGFWYDQHWDEWVMVVAGEATIEFENTAAVDMGPGDYLFIEAHCRHRVASTSKTQKTVWLAVHIEHKG